MIHAGYVLISASECCPFHQPLVFFHEKLFPLSPPSSSTSLTTSCYWVFFVVSLWFPHSLSLYSPLYLSLSLILSVFISDFPLIYLPLPLYTCLFPSFSPLFYLPFTTSTHPIRSLSNTRPFILFYRFLTLHSLPLPLHSPLPRPMAFIKK